jgi:uncharacterized membrane protein YGL010W
MQALMGERSSEEWVEAYEEGHTHPVNRLCHAFGIPMIALSIPLFIVSLFVGGFWRVPAALFTVGWGFQFVGHAFEGKPPEFMKDPRFLLVGLRWWIMSRLGHM